MFSLSQSYFQKKFILQTLSINSASVCVTLLETGAHMLRKGKMYDDGDNDGKEQY